MTEMRKPDEAAPGKSRSLLTQDQMVDHFKVIRLIGRGGMGEVYMARDTKLGRKVALKVVRREAIGTRRAVERFAFEARVTARFSHPHIVTIFAVGDHEGSPYVALEYLEGQTLRERLAAERPAFKEALRIANAIAQALDEAHRNQILHRDLKPENIFLPKDGRLRVLDFGLAKPVSEDHVSVDMESPVETAPTVSIIKDPEITRGKGLRGTPAYMAPEQWRERPVGPPADVWAFGVMLYELLSGKHPYAGLSYYELAIEVGAPKTAPQLETAKELPALVTELVESCLFKDPEKRPSAGEIAERLEESLFGTRVHVVKEKNPFRGLLPFDEQDSDCFYGRDDEVAAFVERLREDPVLPVVGPSGAGKSSFVQAGVIPRLREQGPLKVFRMRPGTQPFATLAARLVTGETTATGRAIPDPSVSRTSRETLSDEDYQRAEAGGMSSGRGEIDVSEETLRRPGQLALTLQSIADRDSAAILLFVDQMEEIYTLVEKERVRRDFAQAICTAADDPLGSVRVVFTLRDDYLGRMAETAEVRKTLGRVTVIRAPGAEALEEILKKPVEAQGYAFEDPKMAQEMAAEVHGVAASLAVLQFAASMLWTRRDQNKKLLLRSAYEAVGGMAGAIAQHVDGVLAGMSPAQESVAREIFLRLVTPEGTRSVLTRPQLLDGLPEEAEEVLNRLIDARTILVRKTRRKGRSESELELVHESLINRWDRLARWIRESQDDLTFLAEVGQAARLWEQRGCRDEEVWHGDALHDAQRHLKRCTAQVSAQVTRFLEAGEELESRLRLRRRLRRASLTIALGVIAAVAVVVALVVAEQKRNVRKQKEHAETQRRRAVKERHHADSARQRARRRWAEAQREGARAALMRDEYLEARAKLRGSLEKEDSALARTLWWQLARNPVVWKKNLGSLPYDVAFSPDGKFVAAACQDKSVYLINVHTRKVRVLRGHEDQAFSVAFSPDGKRLAAGTWKGRIRIWNLTAGTATNLHRHTDAIWSLDFSPDGRYLASASYDKTVRIWNLKTGGERKVLRGHMDKVRGVAFSPDGALLASAGYDKTIRIWDAATGQQKKLLSGHEAGVYSVKFSPDGRHLASGGYDKTVRTWNAASGEPMKVLKGHRAGISKITFGRNGRLLASSSYDKTIRIWDPSSGELINVLRGHAVGVYSTAFSPDGALLASVSRDKSVRLWKPAVSPVRAVSAGHSAGAYAVAFSPDGTKAASGSMDKTIRIWDMASGAQLRVLRGHKAGVWSVEFSRDGKHLASGSVDSTVRVWSVDSGAQARVFAGHTGAVFSVAFSPNGRHLASSGYDKTVRVWDVKSGAMRKVLKGHGARVWAVTYSPDGRLLASGGADRTIRTWNAANGWPGRVLRGHKGPIYGIAFSSDGRYLASGGGDRTLRLWDMRTGQGRVLGSHGDRVYRVSFDPVGKRVAASCADGAARIWPLESGKPVVLRGHRGEVNGIRFGTRGKVVATGGDDGTVRLWDATTGKPHWRAALLLHDPPEILTHRGWILLDAAATPRRAESAWRKAVQTRASAAWQAERGRLLCVHTHAPALEIWDRQQDRRVFREVLPGLRRVQALPEGCVTLASGQVRLYNRAGAFKQLRSGASAMTVNAGRVLVTTSESVVVFDKSGKRLAGYKADVGVTAMQPGKNCVVLGYENGNIQLVRSSTTGRKQSFLFEEVVSSEVVGFLDGPMGTVIAAYANGTLGIWNLVNGKRLYHTHLHGPVVRLFRKGKKLYAVTELGDYRVFDLRVFGLRYCELVRRVWREVKVVWESGLPRLRPPPKDHRCWRR